MLNSIVGKISGKTQELVFVTTGTLEWEIAMPLSDIESLIQGEEYRIFTWMYHREDTMRLFGFCNEMRRNTFLELIKVDGIGPKGAIKILGGISQNDLENALKTGNLARLEAVPGLGTKTAQKMLLALKGKLIPVETSCIQTANKDLIQALVDMGYDKKSAMEALSRSEQILPNGIDDTEKEKILFRNAIVFLSGASDE